MLGLAILARGRQALTTVGEIEVFVSVPCRNQGLGSLLLEDLLDLAAKEGLHWLKAEVAADQRQAIQAFLARGFDLTAVLDHYFCDPHGVPRDAVLLLCGMQDHRQGICNPGVIPETDIF
jgi:L-amino acid N-acyltransferase YncA